jgi:purine-binding chemotaxis protein CheW
VREDAPGTHSLSFFAAPVQDHRTAVEATEHLATFFLDREEYGVDVRQVQEIRRTTEITSVPRAPEFIRGVINLRGRILPVLDLKRKLGLGEVEAGRATRIVVVRVKERLLGLLVDGASQVLKVEVSRIEPPPEEVVEKGGDYIRGVAKLDDRLIILVDLERLLAHELRAASAPGAVVRAAAGTEEVS